jgi:hypothetical protein
MPTMTGVQAKAISGKRKSKIGIDVKIPLNPPFMKGGNDDLELFIDFIFPSPQRSGIDYKDIKQMTVIKI